MRTDPVDLAVDLNTVDQQRPALDFLDHAADPSKVQAGHHLLVGSGVARAAALVVDVTDGIVHVRPLRGSVAANAHLLDASSKAS